tara:strand:- start:2440 stop:4296 length:1857 start_codon:yes stop_codon:yes gene_type:complete
MSYSGELIIWDIDEKCASNSLTTILWKSFSNEKISNIISMPEMIEQNPVELRAKYLDIIYELGQKKIGSTFIVDFFTIDKKFNYWWLTLINEKSNFAKSKWITDAISLIALEKFLEKNQFSSINLKTKNKNLVSSIQILCSQKNINFRYSYIRDYSKYFSFKFFIKLFLPTKLKSTIWFINYLILRWKLKGIGLDKWKKSKGNTTFVSYLFNLNSRSLSTGIFHSNYWGKLPDIISRKKISTNWLHIYEPDKMLKNANEAKTYLKRFNNNPLQSHVTIDTFLSLKIVSRTIKHWMVIIRKGKTLLKKIDILEKKNYLLPFLKKDLKESFYGHSSIKNLLYLNLIDLALTTISHQKKCIYLQENQGWEFGLLQSWRAAGHGKIIGSPHSTVRFWDLRYFSSINSFDLNNIFSPPRPDFVGLNGKLADNHFKKSHYPKNEIIGVEALRYNYLNQNKKNSYYKNNRKNLLILGDYIYENTNYQLRLIEEIYEKIKNDFYIIFKGHPNCKINLNKYSKIKINYETSDDLSITLNHADLAFTSSETSASLDAYCYGLRVISYLNPRTLNINPLREVSDVDFVKNSAELLVALKNYQHKNENKKNVKSFFYTDVNLKSWINILN